jgi:hypothetical protein
METTSTRLPSLTRRTQEVLNQEDGLSLLVGEAGDHRHCLVWGPAADRVPGPEAGADHQK